MRSTNHAAPRTMRLRRRSIDRANEAELEPWSGSSDKGEGEATSFMEAPVYGDSGDVRRHVTTALFAALNILDGRVISMCQPQHRHNEWLKFLRLIGRRTLKHLSLHLVVDNYATHSHPEVQSRARPRGLLPPELTRKPHFQ